MINEIDTFTNLKIHVVAIVIHAKYSYECTLLLMEDFKTRSALLYRNGNYVLYENKGNCFWHEIGYLT